MLILVSEWLVCDNCSQYQEVTDAWLTCVFCAETLNDHPYFRSHDGEANGEAKEEAEAQPVRAPETGGLPDQRHQPREDGTRYGSQARNRGREV